MRRVSPWLSLSVVAKIIEGDNRRKLEGSVLVPSVLIKIPDTITYVSCADCQKKVEPYKTCTCTTSLTKIRFMGRLRLEDDMFELRASCFDAMQSLVDIFADGENEKQDPIYFHNNSNHMEDLRMTLEAIPFTLLLSFVDSEYNERIEVSIRAVEKTFHADSSLLRHPRKPILRCTESCGLTSFCPPCLVADTSFEEGAGLIKIPGGTSQKFRTLLTIRDNPPRVESGSDDNSPVVRCARKVQCSLHDTVTDLSYVLAIEGPINVATQLIAPRKGDVVFAVVTWRSTNELTLLAYAPAPSASEELISLKTF